MITKILLRLLNAVEVLLAIGALHHYWLLLASLRRVRPAKVGQTGFHCFAIAIPAYNEEAVIGQTVNRLRQIDYPPELFDVVIVADHCTDRTAQVVRANGGICHERSEGLRGRKGYALGWLLTQLMADKAYDAFVVLDADSRVVPEFLKAFNAALNSGFRVAQGQHMIANPFDSTYASLAAIDMRLNNRLRNRARQNMGYSARLMGDAMCFARSLLEDHPWDSVSLVEDIEYGIRLVQKRERIAYVAEAISYGEAAGNWRQAEKQRVRWEGGVLDLRQRLPIQLIADGLQFRRWELLDRGIELIMPPYSLLSAASLLATGARFWLIRNERQTCSSGWLLLPLSFVTLPVWGLIADRAAPKLYLGLLFGPVYLLWRVSVRIRAILGRGQIEWVRTPRKAERPTARS